MFSDKGNSASGFSARPCPLAESLPLGLVPVAFVSLPDADPGLLVATGPAPVRSAAGTRLALDEGGCNEASEPAGRWPAGRASVGTTGFELAFEPRVPAEPEVPPEAEAGVVAEPGGVPGWAWAADGSRRNDNATAASNSIASRQAYDNRFMFGGLGRLNESGQWPMPDLAVPSAIDRDFMFLLIGTATSGWLCPIAKLSRQVLLISMPGVAN